MKFLVFQHVPHEHPGLLTRYAEQEGVALDIVELWKNYKIPSVPRYNALIIMGGPMGVYDSGDKYPSKDDEVAAIKNAVGNIPVLGICLGSQILAHTLGAKVYPNTIEGKRVKEIGYYTVDLTPEGRDDIIFRGFSPHTRVLQWHGDAFDLPAGAKLLATSPLCRTQAFSYGNAYGLLFHFEFTPQMIERQTEIDKDWIHKDHEIGEAQLLEEANKNAPLMEKQCKTLFDNFLSMVKP